MNDWMKDITIDLITEGYNRQLAETIGISSFLNLCEHYGGNTIYIPKIESIQKPIKYIRIVQEFTGNNYLELAIKYKMSERWIRELCNQKNKGLNHF